ncbi:hypothetical protein HBI56_129320 [Parastagonospora nodorum]|uniref:NAD(P)-binding protein n=2 Tax=Phaeosphaeria nodorum (strain SN15 / ATCC MYA-4574 / FGSC 10173) TaxID=321614 RepID=A0A7U2F3C3_PHANO|nr:hypothetical protein SNOG_05567 [Parastagonospora nodorum SN15]KAH3909958.1 hypothetical protein HBH56_154520 [Parastagonospora nodorum]EAT86631.1 hypothetical protein SNOG_05567 [Parastagonospora nodorum SN15]KAH3926725.1 hypothetical protein HBH54_163170 [Parastagonospora nodorum]KAH3943184.1 hypothetical protein HBH53_176030 [Parastagonospora nodorum]KAH3970261.1 hypothetical protein HBH52_167700 [Parastagonospora nodorum]
MSQFQIIGEQYKKLPVLINSANVGGKTYIVTGGNTGIGLETARHLVKADAGRVIISSRKISAGEAAKADIEGTTGRKNVVEVWQLDLTSFASVKEFAAKASGLERIDALIENAGVMTDKFAIVEGNETSMTVNVVSPFLLAALLMPKLQETAQQFTITPHIIMVGSALALQANKELEKGGSKNIFANLNDAKITDRYPLTKLVQLYALREWATRYPAEKTNVIMNMTAPGVCSTGLARDTNARTRALIGTIRFIFARTPEEGSRTTVHGVVADKDSHGKFLSGCQIKDWWVPAWAKSEQGLRIQKQLWEELTDTLETTSPGVMSNIKSIRS